MPHFCLYSFKCTSKCSHTHVHLHTSLQDTLDCRIICNCEYIRFSPYTDMPTDIDWLLECAHMCCVCTFPWAAARWFGLWLDRASVPSLTVLPTVGLRQVIKGWRRRSRSTEEERMQSEQRKVREENEIRWREEEERWWAQKREGGRRERQ